MWRGYQSCGEVTQPSLVRLSNLWRDYLLRGYLVARLQSGYRWQSNISLESATFQLHFGFRSLFSAILEVGLSRRHLGLGWFGPPTTHLTTHKQHIWAFNWWINEVLCFSYCIIIKLESTERSFKSWNDILSHKFFHMSHGFPFFRPSVTSRRLTEYFI